MQIKRFSNPSIINFIGKDFADSTIRNAFKGLSSRIESLDNHSYIDIETIENNKRGRPVIGGKLSEAAQKRIFGLVTPVKCAPQVYNIGLDKIGRIEVPSLSYEKAVDRSCTQRIWLPPKDILELFEQKIGIKELNRSLKESIKDGQAREVEVSKTHRWGRPPRHQYRLSRAGLERLATDQNPKIYSVEVSFRTENEEDSLRLASDGMIYCPSCGNPTPKK